jgi:hypothetical protein
VMTQVDLGLTRVGRFDSADPVISVNAVNQKPGASQPTPLTESRPEIQNYKERWGRSSCIEVLPKKFSWLCPT